jgi:hypothetical protein
VRSTPGFAFSKWRLVGAALVLLFAAALGFHSGDELRYVDEKDYDKLAHSILNTHTFSSRAGNPVAYRPPGYPAILAIVYSVVDRPVAAKVFNALLLVAAAFTLSLVAKRIDPASSHLVPYLLLAYPLALYASSTLYPQVLGCLLLAVVIWSTTSAKLGVGNAFVAGICYGVLCLAIPSFLLTLPVIAACAVFYRHGTLKDALVSAAVLCCAAGLTVIPWTIRNYIELHAFAPISTNTGMNLFVGNSERSKWNSIVEVDSPLRCNRVVDGMKEIVIDKALKDCAVDWVTANPGRAAILYVGKVANYFNFRNELGTATEGIRWRDWISFVTYYGLLSIVLVRWAFIRSSPFTRVEATVYWLYFSNAFLAAIFFTRLRFRIPFDFLLIAVEAAAITRAYAWWRRRA